MDDAIDPTRQARLDDYFAGRLPLAERIEMDRWVAEREDRRQLVAELRALWARAETAAPDIGPVNIRQVLNTLAAQREAMDVGRPVASPLSPRPARRRSHLNVKAHSTGPSSRVWPSVLAACAAVAVAVVGLDRVRGSRERARGEANEPPAPREFVTRSAQRAELRLADGTRVLLAPESKLSVPAQFDSIDRAVALEGQAYFDVVHNNAKPFVVRARHAVVHDLGTRFDVRAFANEASVRVVVTDGQVTVGNDGTRNVPLLSAGDMARLGEIGAPGIARGVDTARFVAWTRGELVFDQTPVREALAELNRWYDIDIQIAGAGLDGRRLTATLGNQTVSEVLSLIGISLNARVERRQRTVTIRAN